MVHLDRPVGPAGPRAPRHPDTHQGVLLLRGHHHLKHPQGGGQGEVKVLEKEEVGTLGWRYGRCCGEGGGEDRGEVGEREADLP